ncbi:MAG TPA: DNA primase [Ktedonobacteraceae bacterium]
MTSTIEAIKAKVDIADEISLVVALQRAGKSLKGTCPFHNERTPSFYVFRETQTWHCFGCNEGGDIFSFVQKQQSLDFREVLLYLAEKAGVSVEEHSERTEEDREIGVARQRLLKLNEEALLWFHQMLLRSKDATQARAYVQERGISTDTVVEFSLGYASEQWDDLSRYLLDRGYTEHELVSGGLARWRESEDQEGMRNGIYDYFRQRVIFPIRDMRGRVIGFGGRALGDGKPKYLNSPQTLLFEKNTVLYAIDMAKDAIKQIGQVVIVEGYVDALIAHQYGTKQTVACIGSAITERHIQQLKKLTKQVTLALDPDAAGSAATEKGIQEALKGFDRTVVPVPLAASKMEATGRGQSAPGGQSKKFGQQQPRGIIRLEEQVDAEINVLQLPQGEDPDEVIRRDLSTWLYAVAHPKPLIDYYFVVKTADLNLREPNGKTEAANRLLPVIGMVSDRIKRDAYVRKLAGMISTDERIIHDALQRVLRGQKTTGVTADFTGKASGRQDAHTQGRGQDGVNGTTSGVTEDDDHGQASQMDAFQHQDLGLDKDKTNAIKWEDYLIGLLLQNPGLSQHVCGIINDSDFAGTDTRELYHILNSVYQRDVSPTLQPFEQFVPSALLPTVARAIRSVEPKSPQDGAKLVKEAVQCATRLSRRRRLQLNTELQYLIREAANSGDKVLEKQLRQRVFENKSLLCTLYTSTPLQG